MNEQFDKRAVKRWRRDIWRAFERERFKPAEIAAAMVFAAVESFGTDVSVLVQITGHSGEYVRKVLKRLRKQRVLSGQSINASGYGGDDFAQSVGACIDAGIAAGVFVHPVDPKRSAAQKARTAETRARGPRRRRVVVADGAVFTPKRRKSNRLLGLPEWEHE